MYYDHVIWCQNARSSGNLLLHTDLSQTNAGLYMLLMWSAMVLVDVHSSASTTHQGRSSCRAAVHTLGARSPGFFLRSRVSRRRGGWVFSLLANSSSSAG